jgi:2-desacetyl-2-hydroxyethyl bacteriochlorophyllide A dehydrogenase
VNAVRWHGPEDIRTEEVETPDLREADDVVLRVTTSAICGSDLHLYHGKLPKVRPGTIVGHEFVGVVEQAGPAVVAVKPTDRCLASMFCACGRCTACVHGHHARCSRYAVFGYGELFGGLDGAQADLVRVPLADMTLLPIPEGLSDERALFAGDILATAYTACVDANIQPGEVVAVVGAGPVGQLVVACSALFGAAAVYVVDLVPERLVESRRFGGVPIDPRESDPVRRLRELNGGRRADVVVEAVGSAPALDTAWRLADTGGRVALVGLLVDEPFPQSAGQTWLRNLTVHTIVGQPYRHRATLLRLIEAGRLQPEAVISETLPLDAAPDAYARLARRETTKVVLKPTPP